MPRNKCPICGTNFTEKNKKEFQAAPRWKNECPACTKKKFEKYLKDYLLKLYSPLELATVAGEYFGLGPGEIMSNAGDDAIVTAITDRVYDRQGKVDGHPPATIGHAIADFVTVFDEIVKSLPGLRAGRTPKKTILVAIIAGIILIAVAITLVFVHL
jgi:hypothetical protein